VAFLSFLMPLVMSVVMLLVVGWFAYQELTQLTTNKSSLP
jgi:hypothetical protein